MIIKSSQRAGHAELAAHLVKSRDIDGTPQTVSVTGSRNLVSNDNVQAALQDMEILSKASRRCQKDLYHISMNPDQVMTVEDWDAAWEAYEAEFGLSHLPYIEVTHDKGEHRQPHKHRVYERVDVDTGLAIHLNHTRIRNEKVARVVEFSLNHPLTIGKHNRTVIRQLQDDGEHDIVAWMQQGHAHDCDRPVANQNHSDVQMEKRTQLPTEQVKTELRECYESTGSGHTFKEAIAEKGYVLARGDKRDFVIVDFMGGIHSPRRRIGVKAKELRDKWQDLQHEQLLKVDAVLQLLKAQWQSQNTAAGSNDDANADAKAESVNGDSSAAGEGAAGMNRLSALKKESEALGKEIQATKEVLNQFPDVDSVGEGLESVHQSDRTHDEALNHWQRHTAESESERFKPRSGATARNTGRGRNTNSKRPSQPLKDEQDVDILQGAAAILERQRRLLELAEPIKTASDADAKALVDYQQAWQERFGRSVPQRVMATSGAHRPSYRMADRWILERLARKGYSRQQARRVLVQASPEVMNQRPGERLGYVRRLTQQVYGKHEKQLAAAKPQAERLKVNESDLQSHEQQKDRVTDVNISSHSRGGEVSQQPDNQRSPHKLQKQERAVDRDRGLQR